MCSGPCLFFKSLSPAKAQALWSTTSTTSQACAGSCAPLIYPCVYLCGDHAQCTLKVFFIIQMEGFKIFQIHFINFPNKVFQSNIVWLQKKNLHAEQQWHNEDKPQTSEQKRRYSSAWMELLHLHVDAKPFLCSYWSVTQAFPASKNPFCIQTEFL